MIVHGANSISSELLVNKTKIFKKELMLDSMYVIPLITDRFKMLRIDAVVLAIVYWIHTMDTESRRWVNKLLPKRHRKIVEQYNLKPFGD